MEAQLDEGVIDATEFDSIYVYDFRLDNVEEFYRDISPTFSFDIQLAGSEGDLDIYRIVPDGSTDGSHILLLNGTVGAISLTGEPAKRWRDVVRCKKD
ncbi:MAG: hypothetical protein AAFM91_07985 [Pseudomonadota bacterium]